MKPLAWASFCALLSMGCQDRGIREAPIENRAVVGRVSPAHRHANPTLSQRRHYQLRVDHRRLEADRGDAEAIMRLRGNLPLAVQTKDAALFDRILARNFTFRAADEFWNREQYIRKRVEEPETVGAARYENLVLQLFGGIAVSTYRNVVELKPAGDSAKTLYMTWASVYVKEDGEWKVGAVHLIDKKVSR